MAEYHFPASPDFADSPYSPPRFPSVYTSGSSFSPVSVLYVGPGKGMYASLERALENAASGTEIHIAAGEHPIASGNIGGQVSLCGDTNAPTSLAAEDAIFLNNIPVELHDLTLDFPGEDAALYGGADYSATREYPGCTPDLWLDNVLITGHGVFGGGRITNNYSRITGDSLLRISGDSTRIGDVCAGYDIRQSKNYGASIQGNAVLRIEGGIFNSISGGKLTGTGPIGTINIQGNVQIDLSNATVGGNVQGDFLVSPRTSFHRTGTIQLHVGAGTLIQGNLAGAGFSSGGGYCLYGTSLNAYRIVQVLVDGGQIKGNLYTGTLVEKNQQAVANSILCTLDGNMLLTIDCASQDVTIGSSTRSLTTICAGSFGKGYISGSAIIRITGDSSRLHLLGHAVEILGDSSNANIEQSFVYKGSTLLFDGFGGEAMLNVQNIGGFTSIEFRNGSQVKIARLLSDKLDRVSYWGFDAADGKTVFSIGNYVKNNFSGDTLDLCFDKETMQSCILMDTNDARWFTGLSSALVMFNGTQAVWNAGKNAFCAGDFQLYVDTEKNNLVLAKNTVI